MRVGRYLAVMAASLGTLVCVAAPAEAKNPITCGGAVLLGGAELLCSHVDPLEPTQLCTFSWALLTPANQIQVVNGSFLLPSGSSNVQVYQGSGFARAASEPILLCRGKRRAP
jgi:hypothetical protein